MPYDARSVSDGGNKGIDEEFSRSAPPGKHRVIGVDTFDGGDWHEGDFDSLQEAIDHAMERVKGKDMIKMHIYNEHGKHLSDKGTF